MKFKNRNGRELEIKRWGRTGSLLPDLERKKRGLSVPPSFLLSRICAEALLRGTCPLVQNRGHGPTQRAEDGALNSV